MAKVRLEEFKAIEAGYIHTIRREMTAGILDSDIEAKRFQIAYNTLDRWMSKIQRLKELLQEYENTANENDTGDIYM